MEYFKNIDVIKYEGKDSKNPLAFKYYDRDRIILGKPMHEHLKFAMSYWHTLCAPLADVFGSGTLDRSYGETDPMAIAKAKARAGFEFMHKLGIEYYCFHDTDVAPEGNSLAEFRDNLVEITDYLKELQDEFNIKLLWGTANVFGNPRYMCGAGTNPDADIFSCAAFQIKNAIDATIKLGGKGYVFWGGREGYQTLLNTDMKTELSNLANLLHFAADYARENGYDGDFYIEPKPKEPTKHQYDFDSATVIGFLREHGLDKKGFKLNIECNHATLAMHTFQHELALARINGFFGSIDANQGDYLLGWDTDEFPYDVREATLCMYEVLKNGGFTNGGLNFDAKARRESNTFDDIAMAYVLGMDTYALGLIKAAEMIEDGTIDEFIDKRYASYKSGIGKKIAEGTTNLKELADYALTLKDVTPQSGRQEMLEGVLNQILYK